MEISIAIALAAATLACSSRTEKAAPLPAVLSADVASPAPPVASTELAALTEVTDPSQVCMVNDQFMGRAQIPVSVGGKTYYGCCAMCKGKLEGDAKARMAMDPVSGQPVDKATAIIGKGDSGAVLYFQSRENLLALQTLETLLTVQEAAAPPPIAGSTSNECAPTRLLPRAS